MITLATSAVLALIDRDDADHAVVRQAVASERGPCRGPWLVPASMLAEVASMLPSRFAPEALPAFLANLERGECTLVCGDEHLPRVRELVARYDDLPVGFSDAAVIACAGRSGGTIATLDRRDVEVVAADGPIALVP